MKLRRVFAWVGGGLFILIALAYATTRYAILIPGWVLDVRDPIEPTQTITWDRPAPGTTVAAPRPPNIVLILADDLGWNDITQHGGVADGSVPTPHIDGIAAAGVQFTSGYAGHSSCAPSRAALLSGRYGTRFGFEFTPLPDAMGRITGALHDRDPSNLYPLLLPPKSDATDAAPARPFAELVMPGTEITLAEVLRERGYHTIHIGKWHLGDTAEARPLAQGFDESLDMASGKYLPDDHPDVVNSRQDFDPIDQFLWATFRHAARWNGGQRFSPPGYITDYYTDAAVDAIRANRDRPFFLYLAHWAVHNPLQALRSDYEALPHIANPRERVYAAMVRSLDRSVGRVLDALRAEGLEDDTLVIFTSDNGGAGYIGLPDVNQPYRGFKLTFFEGGIKVPFFMRWPARIPAGLQVADSVHHFDIFATAVAAAGGTPPGDRTLDGVDLLPWTAAADRAPAAPDHAPHTALFWRSGHYQAVRAGQWKLQRADRPQRVWLHNLAEDPTEQSDLSAAEPERVAELMALLDRHNAAQAPPAWPASLELPMFIDKTSEDAQDPSDTYVYVPN